VLQIEDLDQVEITANLDGLSNKLKMKLLGILITNHKMVVTKSQITFFVMDHKITSGIWAITNHKKN
jgi:hypothetical protein